MHRHLANMIKFICILSVWCDLANNIVFLASAQRLEFSFPNLDVYLNDIFTLLVLRILEISLMYKLTHWHHNHLIMFVAPLSFVLPNQKRYVTSSFRIRRTGLLNIFHPSAYPHVHRLLKAQTFCRLMLNDPATIFRAKSFLLVQNVRSIWQRSLIVPVAS